MKKINNIFIAALFSFSVLLFSCGEDENVASCSEEALKEASEELLDITFAFSNNPTKSSCEAYVKSLNDYINEFEDCPGVSADDIEELREQIALVDCSNF